MKLNKWLYGAAALAMLAACSDKDVAPVTGGDVGKNDGIDETISGYLAVQINLPEQSVTRAEGDDDSAEGDGSTTNAEDKGAMNDQFNDGTQAEYNVKNAMIVLFMGEKQDDATFYKAIDLTKPFFTNEPEHDNITSSYIAAVPVAKLTGNNHYWGLAILNRDNKSGTGTYVDSDPNGVGFNEGVYVAGHELEAGETKLSDILEYKIADTSTTENFITDNGFFMTNAPLAIAEGSASSAASQIRYLTDLGNQTWPTKSEAKEHVNGCIYVERAVAKVTCQTIQPSAFQLKFYGDDGKTELEGITIDATVKFQLTNRNKKSYVVRNVLSDNNHLGSHFSWSLASELTKIGETPVYRYRMIGQEKMPALGLPYHDSEKNRYRTYWCHDPNYNVPMPAADKELFNDVASLKSTTEALYCNENTFDVANQTNGSSTMVVFQVDYTIKKNGVVCKDLFIRDGDKSKIYVSKESAAAPEITRIYNDDRIKSALTEALKASKATNKDDYLEEDGNTIKLANVQEYLVIEFGNDNTDPNLLAIKSISLKAEGPFDNYAVNAFKISIGTPDGSDLTEGEEEKVISKSQVQKEILADVNKLTDITQYKDGISYYQIPIKHFGEYYTPWDKTIVGTTTQAVYNGGDPFTGDDDHAKNYLGRYGVVRNNWYDLNISSLTALGSPNIPTINVSLSDDNNEEKGYIALEIHVLSWAKRTQDVEF